MSYARWSDSDVYVYDCVGVGLICESCSLVHGPAGVWIVEPFTNVFGMEFRRGDRAMFGLAFVAGDDAAAMLDHLRAHRSAGEDVADAIECLTAEVEAGDWTAEARAVERE